MNKVASQKYGFSPDFVEEKTLNDEKFCEIYDFHRLVKVQKFAERYERNDIKSDRRFRNKKSTWNRWKSSSSCWKVEKNEAPGTLHKSATECIPFFNREQIFIVRKDYQK